MVNKEKWDWLPDNANRYAVSTFGRVAHYQYYVGVDAARRPKGRPKIVEPVEDGFGRKMVFIWVEHLEQFKPIHVHELVLLTFKGKLFKDGDFTNCSLSNLGWT